MHIEPERHRTPFISLTPLIDVVFILLVFFMLATRFGQFYDLPVNVQPADSINKPDDKWLVIEVEADGDLNLNGVSFTPDAVADRLDTQKSKVWVTVSADATLQQALAAVDAIKAAGVKDVQLELLP
ncbi:MAG TPA: biopolymer transporter ExbD [Alcanivorax sp.]|jgi:biopolymer transport protein ExbD|uniref:Ferric siderophore transport system inner membrane protein E n=1 Tax=Alcanivorax jadensis T9 TaxID=1177181 RepID=A0ABR4W900_9GAMM|nr:MULTISPECIES: biopolymer transporter ExbD [Alcanivorax]KGD59898.1 ferric siderophore transport system inner membrane protein E [Alcanivorax jadensis T9]MAC13405.1 biopolymer transporter ExbD [Alcanivorax sp.]MBG32424.1 biopolymer transporter ExbD [Alcanivorax sp.]MBP23371.1 biopolymer transporter ExbD [Alcanivorax sp.]MDF1638945.1 biopolymer transporter ExbD [Alcanivorax jadensis]|tara:strand:- start:617 stop:997 length:381 start_codon:yes stop_codon:yes gene_type:complete